MEKTILKNPAECKVKKKKPISKLFIGPSQLRYSLYFISAGFAF